MSQVKLIYFEGCPNSKHAKAALLGSQVEFDAIKQDDLPKGDPHLGYSSPTIIKGDQIIFGQKLGPNTSACTAQQLDETKIREKLALIDVSQLKKGKLASIGSFGSALTVGLCPVCIPAIGAFLSSIGLGFLTSEAVLKPVLFVFLGIALFGFLWSYLKEHRNISPLILGIAMSAVLYIGRYVYVGSVLNLVLMYGGIVGIVSVSIWNIYLRKQALCSACRSDL